MSPYPKRLIKVDPPISLARCVPEVAVCRVDRSHLLGDSNADEQGAVRTEPVQNDATAAQDFEEVRTLGWTERLQCQGCVTVSRDPDVLIDARAWCRDDRADSACEGHYVPDGTVEENPVVGVDRLPADPRP